MEAEIEGESIVLRPKAIIDSTESKRQKWIKNLIETGSKNPARESEEEIIKACKETRKEINKELYGKEPK